MNIQEKINLHTHSTLCDGKNSPEEMILSAIQKNFSIIGFSSHSTYPLTTDFYTSFDSVWHIPDGQHQNYVKTIRELSEKYADKIKVLVGFEADYFSNQKFGTTRPDFSDYKDLNPDYLIGSVHFVANEKGLYSIDHKTEVVAKKLLELYSTDEKGTIDSRSIVHDYFEAERQMLKTCNFSILGHPDLIRLRNQDLHYFDENESWYKEELKATAKEAAKAGVVVEINTGAIARNLMKDVYPSAQFLECLYENKVPVCVNSDSHAINTLDCAFDLAYKKARTAGYTELVYPAGKENIIIKL